MHMHPKDTDPRVRMLMNSEKLGDRAEARVYHQLHQEMKQWGHEWEIGWSVPVERNRQVDFLILHECYGAALIEVKQPPMVAVQNQGWTWPLALEGGLGAPLEREAVNKQIQATTNAFRDFIGLSSGKSIKPEIHNFLILTETSQAMWRKHAAPLPTVHLKHMGEDMAFPMLDGFVICLADQLHALPHLIASRMKERHPDKKNPRQSEKALWECRDKIFQCAGLTYEDDQAGDSPTVLSRPPAASVPLLRRPGSVAAMIILALLLSVGGWSLLHATPKLPDSPPQAETAAPAKTVAAPPKKEHKPKPQEQAEAPHWPPPGAVMIGPARSDGVGSYPMGGGLNGGSNGGGGAGSTFCMGPNCPAGATVLPPR